MVILFGSAFLAGKIILSLLSICVLASILYNLRDDHVIYRSGINRRRQWRNLQTRELSMRLQRLIPGCRLRGFTMFDEDYRATFLPESEFETYVAEMWRDDRYFRDMARFARTRYFFGKVVWQPTEREVYEFHVEAYGNNTIRDDLRGRYAAWLHSQTFVRTNSRGRELRHDTGYNAHRLAEMVSPGNFTMLLCSKKQIEAARRAAPTELTEEWNYLDYQEAESAPVTDVGDATPLDITGTENAGPGTGGEPEQEGMELFELPPLPFPSPIEAIRKKNTQ
jgi:hypothetical protein